MRWSISAATSNSLTPGRILLRAWDSALHVNAAERRIFSISDALLTILCSMIRSRAGSSFTAAGSNELKELYFSTVTCAASKPSRNFDPRRNNLAAASSNGPWTILAGQSVSSAAWVLYLPSVRSTVRSGESRSRELSPVKPERYRTLSGFDTSKASRPSPANSADVRSRRDAYSEEFTSREIPVYQGADVDLYFPKRRQT